MKFLSFFKIIACGTSFTLILNDACKVYGFGDGSSGQLGRSQFRAAQPVLKVVSLDKQNIIKVSCGANHSACISETGDLYTFGGNEYGQLGNGDMEPTGVPTWIKSIPQITKVSCGDFHTIALAQNGQVYSWGKGENGQLVRKIDLSG